MAAPFFVSVAMAQAGAAGENNMYNRLKNDGTGGPAPRRSVTGVWTGALEAIRPEVSADDALGQKLFSASKTEANTGSWADVNDPWKTCDPFGMPRSAVNEIRGISFAEMPEKIIVLHQYNRVWRDVWMDGRPAPEKRGSKGRTGFHLVRIFGGPLGRRLHAGDRYDRIGRFGVARSARLSAQRSRGVSRSATRAWITIIWR